MKVIILIRLLLIGCVNKRLKEKEKPLLEAAITGNIEELIDSPRNI